MWLAHDYNPSTWEAVLGYTMSSKAIHATQDRLKETKQEIFNVFIVFPNFYFIKEPRFENVVCDKMAQGVMAQGLFLLPPTNV